MKKFTTLVMVALAACCGFADDNSSNDYTDSAIGLSIAAPLQLPGIAESVYGFRYNLFMAMNKDVYGLDLGLAGINTGRMKGLQINAFNWSGESVDALEIGVLANVALDDVNALQIGMVNVVRGDFAGLQLGLGNVEESFAGFQVGGLFNWNSADSFGAQFAVANADLEEFTGFSCGVVNKAAEMTGCQLGVINLADRASGLQLGVVNAAENMSGVQIGFVNLICSGPLPTMVVANANF